MKRQLPRGRRPSRHAKRWLYAIHPSKWEGARFLVVYGAMLYLIPAPLIVRPLGAAGTPAAIWAMAGLLWWTCSRVGGMVPRVVENPVGLAIGVFSAAVLASYAWGMTTGWYSPADVRGTTDDLYDLMRATPNELREVMLNAADRGLMALAAWVGVVLIGVSALRTWTDIERVVRWLVVLATIVASLGLLQFVTGIDIAGLIRIPGLVANSELGGVQERSVLRRVQATATHPIEFGVVMAAIFPLALHRAVFATRRMAPWLPPALVGTAALMSISKSAVLAMAFAFSIMFVRWPRHWRFRALVAIPVAAVIVRLLIPGLLGTIRSLWTNLFGDASTTGRTGDYGVMIRIFESSPVLGRGHFTFVPRYYRIIDNQLLVSLVELGVVGFSALLLLVAVAYISARGALRRAAEARERHLGLALAASIAGVFVSYATFDAFGFPMVAGTTFLLIGLAGAAWQAAKSDEATAKSKSGTLRPTGPPKPAASSAYRRNDSVPAAGSQQ